ncbi:amidase family protein [Jeotgalibaca sp. YN-L-12]|nr:amidase family protein [Jeotgalibaca caeni]MDE1549050.1 amidase family protein [Jeotgalibaca caeni]
MDATEQARMVREKIASPLELVEEAIKVIKEKNPSLNAVVHERFESAREEAKNRNNEGKPFGGVPLLLKELGQNMTGLPDASGSRLLQNVRAQETNHLVSRLVDAGFIVLGQTNVPEFGFKNITDSQLYGDAKNPYDVRRTPGGSSGGSAAAVSSGMVQAAGASDGGGSIRIPASYTD